MYYVGYFKAEVALIKITLTILNNTMKVNNANISTFTTISRYCGIYSR